MARLLCPVRRCGAPLARESGAHRCPAGHAFDVARSGYVNLLSVSDRRSAHPGDSREAALARRRLLDAGHRTDVEVLSAVVRELDALESLRGDRPAVLDVGCGEGFFAGSFAARRRIEAHGVDISTPAIELAAKRYPNVAWIVANADRSLPWEDGAFDLVLSITGRRNGPELRRVLAPAGRAVVVIPAEDDLIELREALLGRGARKDRTAAAVEELRADLTLVSRQTVRHRERLEATSVRDLLAATYRGGRAAERERADRIGSLDVTMSRDILVFRPDRSAALQKAPRSVTLKSSASSPSSHRGKRPRPRT